MENENIPRQSLYLIRGLPGSGKTTVAKKMQERSEGRLHVRETDQFFETHGISGGYKFDRRLIGAAHDLCYSRTMHSLWMGYNVAVSNHFTTGREIRRYIDGVNRAGLGEDVVIYVIKCEGEWKSPHDIPQSAVNRMKRRWEDFPDELIFQGFDE